MSAATTTDAASERPIVVIEDEDAIRDVVEYNLVRAGFRVLSAGDGLLGLDTVRRELPRLVVLDLMLPELDGIELCRRLRADAATRSIPVIMLTAKGEEHDVVLGLEMGADDYMTKPFSPKELVARVHAVLRRAAALETPQALDAADEADDRRRVELGGIRVDPARHEVIVDGEHVRFTRTELHLLHALLERPGRVYTRERLLVRVMGDDAWITERTVDVHIRAIRKKLGARADVVETIRGVGYRARDLRADGAS